MFELYLQQYMQLMKIFLQKKAVSYLKYTVSYCAAQKNYVTLMYS